MKKTLSRILFLSLAFCFLLLALPLTGCSSVDDRPVLSLGDLTFTAGMYRYQLAMKKTELLSKYYQENIPNATEFVDIPAFWDGKYDEKQTVREFVENYTLNSARATLYYANLAKKQGVSLSEEEYDAIRTDLAELIELKGSESKLNDYLAIVGLDYDELFALFEMQDLATKMQNTMYNMSIGPSRVTDEEMWQYYLENYAVVKHVFINNFTKKAETGKTVPLTGEEKEEKQALIDSVVEGLKAGKDIKDFAALSEDNFSKDKPDGLVIYKDATGFTDYENAALKLKVGDYTVLEIKSGDYTGSYIIKRYKNTEEHFLSELSAAGSDGEKYTYKQVAFVTLTQEKIENTVKNVTTIVTDTALIETLTVADAPLLT